MGNTMKKIASLITVILTFNLNGPNCHHVQVCDDQNIRCIITNEDELQLPVSALDDPLLVEAKLLIREQQAVQKENLSIKQVQEFFSKSPTFEKVDTGQISVTAEKVTP